MAANWDTVQIIDGAMGTELDRRGVDVSLPLWSARALINAPKVVEEIHVEYLEAGAQAITTNTFRTHQRSLAIAGMFDRARELTQRAVEIACSARDRVNPEALVLGGVSPLEDCYRPDLSPESAACRDEHERMITHLLDSGVDLILLETMGTRHEALAAADVARRLAPDRWMISFCMKHEGPPGILLYGAPLVDLLPALGDAVAIGVNCIAASAVADELYVLRAILPEHARLLAYANIGHADSSGRWISTDAVDPERYAEYAETWMSAGASIVGGCCGTTPESIRAMADRLARRETAGGA